MISYIQLINKVESFCNAHLQVRRFSSDFKEQMENFGTKTEEYPFVYMVPVDTTASENIHVYTVDIYCWDIIQKNRVNINTILSDTNLILTDMYHYFTEGTDYSLFIQDTPNIIPLNNSLLDYTAGSMMRVKFEIDAYTDCVIPLSFNVGPVPPSPQVAIFQNSDGSFIQEIAGGDTFTSDDVRIYVYDQNDNFLGSQDIPSNINSNVVVELEPCPPIEVNAEVYNTNEDLIVTQTVTDISPVITFPDTPITLIDSNGDVISDNYYPSGVNSDLTAPDGTVIIKNSGLSIISTQNVKSNSSQDYTISDSIVTLKNSIGVTISNTNVEATENIDITAPDGSITVNGSSIGGVKSNGTRDLSVKLNGIESGTYDGVNTINVTATNAWVRPNGWVALDNVTTGTNNFSGVFAVYETQKSVCTIQISFPGGGTRLINWGDGTTQAALNNTIYTKVYDYSTITSDVLQDEGGFNYKTVVINFPLNSATSLFLERNTTATLIPNNRSLNWLDVALDCSTITSMYCSSQAYSNKLQRLRVYNVGATIDGAGANFTQLVSLRVLKFPFEKMQSSNQVFTNYCGDFRDEDNNPFNLNLTINTGSLFNFFSNGLLSEFGNVSAPLSTSGQGVFTNNYNLKKIGTINLPSAANLVDFISNCVNLESVVNITTSSTCTSLTNLGIGNKKCRGFIISNCNGVTSATNAFNQMVSMETLILTGMTRGFNIDDCNLSATAIDALFTSLGTASGSQTINVRRNPGSATCTTSIATTKGFTVVVS